MADMITFRFVPTGDDYTRATRAFYAADKRTWSALAFSDQKSPCGDQTGFGLLYEPGNAVNDNASGGYSAELQV